MRHPVLGRGWAGLAPSGMVELEVGVGRVESDTAALFGELWTKLSDAQFKHSVELFTKRALANDFDLAWLRGRRCLDAGCGSGRYAVAMALHGAGEITAVDISEAGLAEARKRAAAFPRITFRRASVLDLPFADGAFDFVWSAGVIHHTADFQGALRELSRVTRDDGKLFLLVYGAGGLRWQAIKALRPLATALGQPCIDAAITDAGLPANNRKHFLDDLFVPIQTLTRWPDLEADLQRVGFRTVTRWTGETFDQEASPEAQRADLDKLLRIMTGAAGRARTPVERHLSAIGRDIAARYVEAADAVMADPALSPAERHDIVIGEANHRLVAEKR